MYKTKDLKNPAVVVDANHSNSSKMYFEQIRIVKEVLHSCKHSADVKQLVKGVMIESYIEPGNQKVGEGVYGKSITDACLGWEEICIKFSQAVFSIKENKSCMGSQ